MDREKRTKLAIRLLHTADELIEQYKAVSTLPARISAPTSEDPKHSTAAKIDKKMAQLNSAFARLLDFVEEQAREEKGAVEASRVDALLVWEISRTHPDWTAPQIKEQLKLAKQEPRARGLATISVRAGADGLLKWAPALLTHFCRSRTLTPISTSSCILSHTSTSG